MPIDYKSGKIYCIRSHQTDEIYIGSTTQKLCARMRGHRRSYKYFKIYKTYKYNTSYKILEHKDAYIELIINCPCNNKEELAREEGKYIRENDCVNRCIAGRTHKEWRQDNKDKVKVHNRKYREKHKEKISERRKKIFFCECGGKCVINHKQRHFRTKKHQNYINSLTE